MKTEDMGVVDFRKPAKVKPRRREGTRETTVLLDFIDGVEQLIRQIKPGSLNVQSSTLLVNRLNGLRLTAEGFVCDVLEALVSRGRGPEAEAIEVDEIIRDKVDDRILGSIWSTAAKTRKR